MAAGLIISMNNMYAMDLLKCCFGCCFGRENHIQLEEELDESSKEYTYETKLRYEHPGVSFVTISPDNRQVLSLASKSVKIMALTDEKASSAHDYGESNIELTHAAFSSDGDKAVLGSIFREGQYSPWAKTGFEVLDLARRKKYSDLGNHSVEFLAFTPDDEGIIVVHSAHDNDEGARVKIVDYTTGTIKHNIKLRKDPIACFLRNSVLYALLPRGGYLDPDNGCAQRVDVKGYTDLPDVIYQDSALEGDSLRCVKSIIKKCSIYFLMQNAAASNDKMAIITNASDVVGFAAKDEIRVHDLESGAALLTIKPFKPVNVADITCIDKNSLWDLERVAISPDGKRLAFGAWGLDRSQCNDEPVSWRSVRMGEAPKCHFIGIADLENNSGTITHRISIVPLLSMLFSPDNRSIFLRMENGHRIIDARAGATIWEEGGGYGKEQFSADGAKAVVAVSGYLKILERKWALKK